MRKGTRLVSALGIMTLLCGVVLATPSQAASETVNMSTELTKWDGTVVTDQGRLIPGQTSGGPIIIAAENVPDAPGWAGWGGIVTTFEAAALAQYAGQLGSPSYVVAGDALWWTKQTAYLYIDKEAGNTATAEATASRVRGNENYAIYAVAPGSSTGFMNDSGLPPSTGGGNPIRLLMQGWFNGGDYSEQPSFLYGDSFADTYGQPPGPTFFETIIEYNQGFALIVDLNAANVQVGEIYQFRQMYKLGTGPGVTVNDFDDLNLAFVKIDPMIGYATFIPEPAAVSLLALGGLAVLRKRRKP